MIGAGMAGSAIANSLALTGIAGEIVLVDRNAALASAEAEDIRHAASALSECVIYNGRYRDLEGCAVCIVAAGVSLQPGETRMEVVRRNAATYEGFFAQIVTHVPDAILIIATCPVDLMVQIACRLGARPASRVIGCGTLLDTMLFRTLIARHFKVAPSQVQAEVVGEHGDSEVLCWTGVEISGEPLAEFADSSGITLSRKEALAIDDGVRRARYRIIEGKGSARYGIAGAVSRIVRAIADDDGSVLTVSMLENAIKGLGPVAVSLPRSIGRAGVTCTIKPLMSDVERRALRRSASIALEGLPPEWHG